MTSVNPKEGGGGSIRNSNSPVISITRETRRERSKVRSITLGVTRSFCSQDYRRQRRVELLTWKLLRTFRCEELQVWSLYNINVPFSNLF